MPPNRVEKKFQILFHDSLQKEIRREPQAPHRMVILRGIAPGFSLHSAESCEGSGPSVTIRGSPQLSHRCCWPRQDSAKLPWAEFFGSLIKCLNFGCLLVKFASYRVKGSHGS